THDLDRALLAKLSEVVDQAGAHMADYDYAHALRVAESFFWEFTDDYVELVKDRSYGASGTDDQTSAHVTLATALDVLLAVRADHAVRHRGSLVVVADRLGPPCAMDDRRVAEPSGFDRCSGTAGFGGCGADRDPPYEDRGQGLAEDR